jgi:hypothetical protein
MDKIDHLKKNNNNKESQKGKATLKIFFKEIERVKNIYQLCPSMKMVALLLQLI